LVVLFLDIVIVIESFTLHKAVRPSMPVEPAFRILLTFFSSLSQFLYQETPSFGVVL